MMMVRLCYPNEVTFRDDKARVFSRKVFLHPQSWVWAKIFDPGWVIFLLLGLGWGGSGEVNYFWV